MKIIALLVLLVAFVACTLSQPLPGAGQQMPAQGQQQPPNFLQYMLMQNLFDSKWLPLMYFGGGGGGGMRSMLPLLMWGNM